MGARKATTFASLPNDPRSKAAAEAVEREEFVFSKEILILLFVHPPGAGRAWYGDGQEGLAAAGGTLGIVRKPVFRLLA